MVERCAAELVELYPGLEVHGVVGDFERHLGASPAASGALVALPRRHDRQPLPGRAGGVPARPARGCSAPGDRLLIGTDLVKDVAVLEAAYNDAAGVTAEFNLNVLHVINRELDADFDVDSLRARRFLRRDDSWIEMRLRAYGAQQVRIAGADLEVDFADGEEIRTEISTKFTQERLERELPARDANRRVLHRRAVRPDARRPPRKPRHSDLNP